MGPLLNEMVFENMDYFNWLDWNILPSLKVSCTVKKLDSWSWWLLVLKIDNSATVKIWGLVSCIRVEHNRRNLVETHALTWLCTFQDHGRESSGAVCKCETYREGHCMATIIWYWHSLTHPIRVSTPWIITEKILKWPDQGKTLAWRY